MQIHQNLNEIKDRAIKPEFLFICQVGDAIRLVEITSLDEMPAVEKWMKDASQWHDVKPLSLYQLVGESEKENSGATGTEQPKPRRGRPPRSESASSIPAAGVVAGGVDPGPLEEEQS